MNPKEAMIIVFVVSGRGKQMGALTAQNIGFEIPEVEKDAWKSTKAK